MEEKVEVATQQEAQASEQAPQQQPSPSELNLGLMRKKLEAEEQARIAAEKRLYEMEQKLNSISTVQSAPSEEQDEIGVDNDDYVQAKHIKTTNKKFSSKLSATDKKIAELEQKLSYFEAKVDTSALKDFDEVVSEDNLKTFARLYPDDYQSMMSNPSLKARSKTAYNMIKNYGIASTGKTLLEADARISQNRQKPQLASNVNPHTPQTPLTSVSDNERRVMTEEYREAVLARVARIKAGRL